MPDLTNWCPTCEAEPGEPCTVLDGPLRGEAYDEPHNSRNEDWPHD